MTSRKPTIYRPAPASGTMWAKMPGIAPAAVGHAVQRLPLVRGILGGTRSDIICFHIEFKGKRRKYGCTLWRRGEKGSYRLEDGVSDITHAALSEICGAFAPLAVDLMRRWPEQARPASIGFASDGHTILFNADHPSCAGPDWMDQHISGRSPMTIIGGDGGSGILDEICPRPKEAK